MQLCGKKIHCIDAESLAKTQLIKTSLWVLLTNGTDPSLKYKKKTQEYIWPNFSHFDIAGI